MIGEAGEPLSADHPLASTVESECEKAVTAGQTIKGRHKRTKEGPGEEIAREGGGGGGVGRMAGRAREKSQ